MTLGCTFHRFFFQFIDKSGDIPVESAVFLVQRICKGIQTAGFAAQALRTFRRRISGCYGHCRFVWHSDVLWFPAPDVSFSVKRGGSGNSSFPSWAVLYVLTRRKRSFFFPVPGAVLRECCPSALGRMEWSSANGYGHAFD